VVAEDALKAGDEFTAFAEIDVVGQPNNFDVRRPREKTRNQR
jgi:hypothetical protein